MGENASKGVRIFAWLLIILNFFIFVFSFNFKGTFDCLKSFHRNFVIAAIFYSLLSSLVGIMVGAGLLKLKNTARLSGIALNGLDLFIGTILFFLSLADVREYSYAMAVSEIAKSMTRLDIQTIFRVIFYSTIMMNWAVLGINLLFIYFFTRPAVRNQFK